MKKVIYLIGLLSSIALAMGWLFSLLHWPGARQLFDSGFIGFLLVFVPLITFDHYKNLVKRAVVERLKLALGCLSAVIVGTSLVFKLLHLQGADHLLVVGMVIFAFGFLPFLFFTNYRKAISRSGQHE